MGILLTVILANGQNTQVQLSADSINAKIRMRYAAYLNQRAIYERLYRTDPRAAIDSVNQVKMQGRMAEAQERLVAYKSNDRIDTVKVIDLSYIGLEELPSFVLNAIHLERLILNYNHIRRLPSGLKNLGKAQLFAVEGQ